VRECYYEAGEASTHKVENYTLILSNLDARLAGVHGIHASSYARLTGVYAKHVSSYARLNRVHGKHVSSYARLRRVHGKHVSSYTRLRCAHGKHGSNHTRPGCIRGFPEPQRSLPGAASALSHAKALYKTDNEIVAKCTHGTCYAVIVVVETRRTVRRNHQEGIGPNKAIVSGLKIR